MKKSITNIEIKKNNRNRIFRYICKKGTVSNPDIAYALKMSLPTALQITKELMEKGVVEEVGELQSTGGRRAKALAVVSNAAQAVGIDITRNHVGLVLTNLTGEMLYYKRTYLPYQSNATYYRQINELTEQFLEESGVERECILGIGISLPAIIDLDRQMITSSHVLTIEAVALSEISSFFAYPCYFLNDANAGAYAEGMGGDYSDHFFFLSLSDTVGGAIFENKHLVNGKNFRCGEVGHMTLQADGKRCYCGKAGCVDVYCSAKCLSEAADGKLEAFFERLDQKEETIVRIWERYTDYLAMVVNNIHMVLDCDIVLGGYVGSYMGEHIGDVRKKVYARNTFGEEGCFVKNCHYGMGSAALGAALEVIERFVQEI